MNRNMALLLAVLALIGPAGGVFAPARGERAALERSVNPQPATAPSTAYKLYMPIVVKQFASGYVSPFGIDMYGGNSPINGQAQMRAAGSSWETVTFLWSSIEPTAPISNVHTYNWASSDQLAAHAQADSMQLFVLFTNNSSWAAPSAGGPVTPTHLADLYSIAGAMAERYDGDGINDAPGSPIVNDFSFYAEPDRSTHWGNQPVAYADMLAGVANAVHAANPHAVVMIGGLAYDAFPQFVRSFLGNVLDRLNTKAGGATAYLDAMPFHYYPISTSLWPTIKEKALEIRGILNTHGAGSLPLIVPEMGYWSQTVPGRPDLDSNESQQARGLVQMFVRGMSVGIQQMSWFAVFDAAGGTEAHGLFRGANINDPKPAYTAYQHMIAELYGAQYQGPQSGPGFEGYVFKNIQGRPETVVWAVNQAAANVVFHQSCVRRADYLGTLASINDGNGAWDKDSVAGQITLQVNRDEPIYVTGC